MNIEYGNQSHSTFGRVGSQPTLDNQQKKRKHDASEMDVDNATLSRDLPSIQHKQAAQPERKRPKTEEETQGLLGFARSSGEEDTDFAETWAVASRNTIFLSLLVFRKDLDKLLKDMDKLEGQKLDASYLKLRATLLWEELEENPAWPDSQNLRAQFQALWDATGDQLQWDSSKFFQIYAAKTSIEDFLKKHYLTDKYHYVDWTKTCPPGHLWVRVFEKGVESQAAEEQKMLDDSRRRKDIQAFQTSPEADRIMKTYKNSAQNAPGVFEFLDSSLANIDAAVELAKEELTCTIQLMRTIFHDSPSIDGLAQIRGITDRLRKHFVERVRFNVHLRKDRVFQELKDRLRKMQPSSGLDPANWSALWNAVLVRFELALNMNLGKTYSDDCMVLERTDFYLEDVPNAYVSTSTQTLPVDAVPGVPASQPQTGGTPTGQPRIETAIAQQMADTLKALWPLALEAANHPHPTDGMIQWAAQILAKHERAMQTRENDQGPASQPQQGLLPPTQAPAATGAPSQPARSSNPDQGPLNPVQSHPYWGGGPY